MQSWFKTCMLNDLVNRRGRGRKMIVRAPVLVTPASERRVRLRARRLLASDRRQIGGRRMTGMRLRAMTYASPSGAAAWPIGAGVAIRRRLGITTPLGPPAARRLMGCCLILAAALLATGASPAIAGAESQVSVGSIQTLAHVPYPGNPGAVAIDGNTMWVDTSSANFDRPFDGYSGVFAYDLRTGQLLPRSPNPIIVPKPPVAVMGLAGIALDSQGHMYIA